MKKANYTLIQPQSWKTLKGALSLLMVFIWCCLGINELHAQNPLVMTHSNTENTSNTKFLAKCGEEVDDGDLQFIDDGLNDGNYSDPTGVMRRDTVEICPFDQWHTVRVVFTDFDLAPGDTLNVYQGQKFEVGRTDSTFAVQYIDANGNGVNELNERMVVPVPLAITPSGTGSGVGVSKAFGGWVDAECDERLNPSGCLTFIFRTNGDNQKGAGWDAWVDCQKKNITLNTPNIQDAYLDCDESFAFVSFPPLTGFLCDTMINPDVDHANLDIINQVTWDTCVATHVGVAAKTFPLVIGQYVAVYTLKSDQSKSITVPFSVQGATLVANDDIIVPIGEGCEIELTPDDVLESYCDTLTERLMYDITITIGEGKNLVELKTSGVFDSGPVAYPIITADTLVAAGITPCNAVATVKVDQVYYPFGANFLTTACNDAMQIVSTETTIRFSDDSAPIISLSAGGPDEVVSCDTTGVAGFFSATATDNCDQSVDVSAVVTLAEDDPCFSEDGNPLGNNVTTAIITYTATDDCGNSSTLSRQVTVRRPGVDRIVVLDKQTLQCNEEDQVTLPQIQIGSITGTVFTPSDSIPLSEDVYTCGYIVRHVDRNIPTTDCGSKIFRAWSVVDWCDPGTGPVALDTTFLEFTDTLAPTFDPATVDPITINLEELDCTYDVNKLTKPSATDNCGVPTVRLDSVFRIEDGSLWGVPTSQWVALDCDSFSVRYVAEDDCHEQLINDTISQVIVIKDVTPPSAVCTDELNVSVPADDGAVVYATEIDGGSSDACGAVSLEVRKERQDGTWTNWADSIIVVCEDVHGGEPKVELRVTDAKGNQNTCWMTITAEDKIPPVCQDLRDTTITCNDIHTGELGASTDVNGNGIMDDVSEWVTMPDSLIAVYNARFGNPICVDNITCSQNVLTYTQQYQLIEDDCGALRAKRRFRAEDWRPNAASWEVQNITVIYEPDWTLRFPADIDLECNDAIPPAQTADDIISNGSCDLFALNVTERTFNVPGDIACMKIERTYEVINWCKFEEGKPAVPLTHDPINGQTITSAGANAEIGRFTYTQVIKLYITDIPTVTINPVEECIIGVGDALPFNTEDVTPDGPAYECDTLKMFSATATSCIEGVELTDFRYILYEDGVQVANGDGQSFEHVVTPNRKYEVEFWASDGCGNSAGERSDVIIFRDCKKPTPYTLNGLAIELGEDGTVDLWANDLDQGSYDNCTPQDRLETYIAKGGPTATSLAEVQALGKSITLTCDDVGTRVISFYVVDEGGNYDVVETFVLVQRNNPNIVCPVEPGDGGMVAGRIVNPNGENVEQVSVAVSGAMQESMVTGTDGQFQFSLDMGANYTVTPVKDMNPLNGVSTFDLVLISKHILGITPFDSPYQHIAADVNKSGSITAFDMVQIRRLILNITTEFEGNDSWRFVDGKYEFTTTNPAAEDFAEFMSIDELSSDMMDVDFIGVKVGDVNASASANSLLGAEVRNTNGALTFNVADRFVEAGQPVKVAFTAADIASAQGYQFTMDFAGLELVEVVEGVAKVANFNTNLAERGVLTTSWDGEANADDVLFTLAFNPTVSGLLSDLISVNSDLTVAEAYNTSGELLDVNIEFSNAAVAANFELTQNSPNPFKTETVIGFNLPEAGTATLKVMDIQGKVLKVVDGDFAKGYNQVTINAKELGATGVLHYRLESADQVATKKMIIIE